MLMSEAKDKRTWKCSFTVFPSSALKYAVSIASTQPGTGERPSCYGVHRQTSHSTRGVHSICCRCQKPHHDGWWVRVVTSKCSLPCAVMHGGLVGSQSAPAVICINNLLWRAIPPLTRCTIVFYFAIAINHLKVTSEKGGVICSSLVRAPAQCTRHAAKLSMPLQIKRPVKPSTGLSVSNVPQEYKQLHITLDCNLWLVAF